YYNVTATEITNPPSVTPASGNDTVPANTSGLSVTFTVQNTGSNFATYSLACSRSGAVSSCSPSQPSVGLSGGGSTSISVTYSTGGFGTGSVTLFASGGGGSDNGSYSILVL